MAQEIGATEVSSAKHGSKITFLVRHLLWLQVNDPGSKSVVFSAWADGLHSKPNLYNGETFRRLSLFKSLPTLWLPMASPTFELTLGEAKSGTLSTTSRRIPKFKFSSFMGQSLRKLIDGIESYQLNSERENSGLNVTSACRVFLLEPTVNPTFELQGMSCNSNYCSCTDILAAIARVDRLGQSRETEGLFRSRNGVDRD